MEYDSIYKPVLQPSFHFFLLPTLCLSLCRHGVESSSYISLCQDRVKILPGDLSREELSPRNSTWPEPSGRIRPGPPSPPSARPVLSQKRRGGEIWPNRSDGRSDRKRESRVAEGPSSLSVRWIAGRNRRESDNDLAVLLRGICAQRRDTPTLTSLDERGISLRCL